MLPMRCVKIARVKRKPQKAKAQTIPAVEISDWTTRGAWRGERFLFPAIAGLLAAVLLSWGLGDKYLWQDEANTAVLATRLLRFGKPLCYDGVNLITVDDLFVENLEPIDLRTKDPKAAIAFQVAHHTFKPDTTWIFHPLGQFVVTAASLKLLGQTTVAARLPFALAALLTVLLLYEWVRRYFGSPLMAQIATTLLIFNSYWILHGRQCRYYSLSSLFLVLTLIGYSYWQSGGRWGAAAFVISAWCWFQVDYGTLWPVLGVLFLDAFLAAGKNFWRPLIVGVVLAATVAPFVYDFRLWERGGVRHAPWIWLFKGHLFGMNEFVVPFVILAAAAVLTARRWKKLPSLERRLVAMSCGILVAMLFWVSAVTPDIFLRYTIMAAPIGCAVSAWVLIRGCNFRATGAWVWAAVLILTPWLSLPVRVFNTGVYTKRESTMLRAELPILWREVFTSRPDPNRAVIEWLKQHAAPTDEILVNYEDLPMMFYLPNPIRGGIAAFRAEDDAKKPPEFLVIRRSVPFVQWPVFQREADRYKWTEVDLKAPDVIWGNFQDPMAEDYDFNTDLKIFVARRNPDAEAATPAPR